MGLKFLRGKPRAGSSPAPGIKNSASWSVIPLESAENFKPKIVRCAKPHLGCCAKLN
jgi:hypothetical protein